MVTSDGPGSRSKKLFAHKMLGDGSRQVIGIGGSEIFGGGGHHLTTA
jgi:hypothetical protein